MSKIRIDRNTDAVEVEITIGQAQLARFTIDVSDSDGSTIETFCQGNNKKHSTRSCVMPRTASQLLDDELQIGWGIVVIAATDKPDEQYHVSLEVKQNGTPVEGGSFTYSGPINNSINIINVVDFID